MLAMELEIIFWQLKGLELQNIMKNIQTNTQYIEPQIIESTINQN